MPAPVSAKSKLWRLHRRLRAAGIRLTRYQHVGLGWFQPLTAFQILGANTPRHEQAEAHQYPKPDDRQREADSERGDLDQRPHPEGFRLPPTRRGVHVAKN